MEPLPPLVACSPCVPCGDAEMPRFRKGDQGERMSGRDKVTRAMLNGQDPWWALWASVADASRPGECHEVQRGKRTSSSGQVRGRGSVRSYGCTGGSPIPAAVTFPRNLSLLRSFGGEKREDIEV